MSLAHNISFATSAQAKEIRLDKTPACHALRRISCRGLVRQPDSSLHIAMLFPNL